MAMSSLTIYRIVGSILLPYVFLAKMRGTTPFVIGNVCTDFCLKDRKHHGVLVQAGNVTAVPGW